MRNTIIFIGLASMLIFTLSFSTQETGEAVLIKVTDDNGQIMLLQPKGVKFYADSVNIVRFEYPDGRVLFTVRKRPYKRILLLTIKQPKCQTTKKSN